jgi:DNA integrity scanning protein DisA with diadenylate cyclase activity
MVFRIEETSHVEARGENYSERHNQLSDAMQKAINWLANKPVGTKVTITEITIVERKE